MDANDYNKRKRERQMKNIELKEQSLKMELEQLADDKIILTLQQAATANQPKVPKMDGSGQGVKANAKQNPECPEKK